MHVASSTDAGCMAFASAEVRQAALAAPGPG